MSRAAVRSILIAGHPRDVWPVAAIWAPELPASIAVHVAEHTVALPPAAATIPLDSPYLLRLGLDLKALVAGCGGVPSLGSMLNGFGSDKAGFVTAPSGALPMIAGVPLHHFLLALVQGGDGGTGFREALGPFRFTARAAEAGKFAVPADGPETPLAMLGPQFSFDCDRYAAMLRGICVERCHVHSGALARVSVAENGAVARVELAGGKTLECDFFIDCSGDLAALTGRGPERIVTPFARLDQLSRAVSIRPEPLALPTYAADPFGLLCAVPAEGGRYVSYLHVPDAPESHIANIVGNSAATCAAPAAPVAVPWTENCVRLAGAAGSLSPILGSDAALSQAMTLFLADCLPASTDMQSEAQAFNRRYLATLSGIEDFSNTPLHLNARPEPVWQEMRRAKRSLNLQARIDQFASRGRIPVFERDFADQQTWTELFAQLGIHPRQHDRRTDTVPKHQATQILNGIHRQLDAALSEMADTKADLHRHL